MGIKIIDEGDIHITQGEMERLRLEYESSQMYTTQPCSFETWLRGRKRDKGSFGDVTGLWALGNKSS